MRMVDIIEKKRDGQELTTAEINFFIEGYTKGEIPDYQAWMPGRNICERRSLQGRRSGTWICGNVESG